MSENPIITTGILADEDRNKAYVELTIDEEKGYGLSVKGDPNAAQYVVQVAAFTLQQLVEHLGQEKALELIEQAADKPWHLTFTQDGEVDDEGVAHWVITRRDEGEGDPSLIGALGQFLGFVLENDL